jgi:hypothetical protein
MRRKTTLPRIETDGRDCRIGGKIPAHLRSCLALIRKRELTPWERDVNRVRDQDGQRHQHQITGTSLTTRLFGRGRRGLLQSCAAPPQQLAMLNQPVCNIPTPTDGRPTTGGCAWRGCTRAIVPGYRTSKVATHPLAYAAGPSSRPISTALRPWWTPLWVAAVRKPLRLMANI